MSLARSLPDCNSMIEWCFCSRRDASLSYAKYQEAACGWLFLDVFRVCSRSNRESILLAMFQGSVL